MLIGCRISDLSGVGKKLWQVEWGILDRERPETAMEGSALSLYQGDDYDPRSVPLLPPPEDPHKEIRRQARILYSNFKSDPQTW